ncbi:uncharacterized protein [Nicotiana tomentosiformis]|uniref:uncharacterized protein n=1 Tax=Nicotiana tomentosiformis TaxID=4098 RepID=UPI00388CE568
MQVVPQQEILISDSITLLPSLLAEPRFIPGHLLYFVYSYMAPKKKARTGKRANITPGVTVDPIIDDAGDSTGSRVNRFLQLDPPVFTGTNPEEDPQDFIDEMHKTLQVMHATKTEAVELASYRLKKVAYSWFELWEESRGEGSSPARWGEFADAFIDHFLPAETKVVASQNSEEVRQGHHSPFLSLQLVHCHQGPSQQQQWSRFRPSQGIRGSSQQGHHGGRFQQQRKPPCPRCGKMHTRICYMDLPIYYGCRLRGHIQRDCHSSRQGAGRGMAQPAISVATTSVAPSPARGTPMPIGRGAARGGAQSSGRSSRFYSMRGHQNSEASPDVVTGILTIQSHDVYAFIDPGSTLSYVTPYVAMEFGIELE